MNLLKKLAARSTYLAIPLILLILCGPTAHAQYLIVDCTGVDLTAYPSINTALPYATPGSFILITGLQGLARRTSS
jgi:hypothetical protein